ncbi:hypothetical protein ACIRON_27225 [Nocardioides sp. NPDC101246]|uniref:hypothetical protein n=1 Tax=Nocardioides sp. NPDC101246 TaxID=3364336 RepID=UPI0038178F97
MTLPASTRRFAAVLGIACITLFGTAAASQADTRKAVISCPGADGSIIQVTSAGATSIVIVDSDTGERTTRKSLGGVLQIRSTVTRGTVAATAPTVTGVTVTCAPDWGKSS